MKDIFMIGNMINSKQIDSHSHNMWEMVYYLDGNVVLTVNDVDYKFSEGYFVCIPPNYTHSEIGLDHYDNYFFTVGSYDILSNKFIVVKDTLNKSIKNEIQQMYYINKTKPSNYEVISNAHLLVIAQYVISQLTTALVNPYIEKFLLKLISNASNCNFKIKDILDVIPYSYDHFRTLFKKEMNCTPIEYLIKMRITNAKELIKNQSPANRLSIAAISRMCGFSDSMYFSRCFKKYTGMTPTKYIELHL